MLNGSNLYSLSREGHLYCLNAEDGKIIWQRQLIDENLAKKNDWGFCSSPVIYENILILNINKAGIAFDTETGKLIWNSKLDKCQFGTPVLLKQNNKTFVTLIQDRKLKAIDIKTGKILWTYKAGWGDADPIFLDDKLLLTGQATTLLNLKKNKPEEIWKNKDISWQFQSVAVSDNNIFGFGTIDWDRKVQAFYSVDLTKGKLNWKKEFEMWGSSIIANNYLIMITGQGKLIIAKTSQKSYEEISSAQVFKMQPNDTSKEYRRECQCWTNPVLVNGNLYLRNTFGEFICLDIK